MPHVMLCYPSGEPIENTALVEIDGDLTDTDLLGVRWRTTNGDINEAQFEHIATDPDDIALYWLRSNPD